MKTIITTQNILHWEGEVVHQCPKSITFEYSDAPTVVIMDGFEYPEADTVMYEFGLIISLPIQCTVYSLSRP